MTAQVLHKTGHMAAPGEARLPPSPERARVASRQGEELAARLREIGAATGVPEDALEPALRTTLEALGARAGALCVFDQRHELLWLAAEVGLSDEGCRALRNVRRGGALTWDMPLHGVINRRAYLIDSAAKNRYVPPLVEPANAVRTIACLPLYADATPVGSLVLISLAPHVLREQDIRALTQPTRELVAMIEAVRKRATAAASASTAATATKAQPQPTRTPAAAAIARKAAPEDAARIQQLTMALSKAEQERDQLAAALSAAGEERATTSRNQAAIEARLVESTTELEWTRLKLADAESAAAKAHERACEAERERERAGVALDAATARERALQGELDSAATRTSGQEVAEALRVAEEARAAAQAEAETTRQALGAAQAESEAVRESLAATQAEAEAVRQSLAAAQTEAESARQSLKTTEAVVAALEEEAQRAHVEIA